MVHQQEYLKLIEEHTRNTEENTRKISAHLWVMKWTFLGVVTVVLILVNK